MIHVKLLNRLYLSFQGVAASCQGEAFPSERRGRAAFPSGVPWAAACLEEVPSSLRQRRDTSARVNVNHHTTGRVFVIQPCDSELSAILLFNISGLVIALRKH